MAVPDLLTCDLTPEEKHISDIANEILDAFNNSYTPQCFPSVKFHKDPSNDPEGHRIIFKSGQGFTLVTGDGDKGLGWLVDGVTYFEKVPNSFYIYESRCVFFIENFENFLDYLIPETFGSKYTSADVSNNKTVKDVLSKYNIDIKTFGQES